MNLRIENAAIDSLMVRLFDEINEANMPWLMAAAESLRQAFGAQLIDLVPSYTTLLLHYDLHTAIRDQGASRHSFVTNSDRLVQMLIEEALGLLPATPVTVTTPCGPYEGVSLPEESTIVAVSILRAADCMLGVCRARTASKMSRV